MALTSITYQISGYNYLTRGSLDSTTPKNEWRAFIAEIPEGEDYSVSVQAHDESTSSSCLGSLTRLELS